MNSLSTVTGIQPKGNELDPLASGRGTLNRPVLCRFLSGERMGFLPKKFPAEVRERAVRMTLDEVSMRSLRARARCASRVPHP
jgi:hypothetical protein